VLLGSFGSVGAERELAGLNRFQVTDTESAWEGNLVVTTLTLQSGAPHSTVKHLRTLGGQVGDVAQRVGHVLPPGVGQMVELRSLDRHGGSTWLLQPLAADADYTTAGTNPGSR
jgi:hypothetical protein